MRSWTRPKCLTRSSSSRMTCSCRTTRPLILMHTLRRMRPAMRAWRLTLRLRVGAETRARSSRRKDARFPPQQRAHPLRPVRQAIRAPRRAWATAVAATIRLSVGRVAPPSSHVWIPASLSVISANAMPRAAAWGRARRISSVARARAAIRAVTHAFHAVLGSRVPCAAMPRSVRLQPASRVAASKRAPRTQPVAHKAASRISLTRVSAR